MIHCAPLLTTPPLTRGSLAPRSQGPIPGQLSRCTNLKTLYIANNPELDGTIPTQLANLPELKVMNLGSNALTGPIPTEIFGMHSLETLCAPPLSRTVQMPSNPECDQVMMNTVPRYTVVQPLPSELLAASSACAEAPRLGRAGW
jgi:hypothetical protein